MHGGAEPAAALGVRSYYHPHFTHSGAGSHVPTAIPSAICSKAALEAFHALCSVPSLFPPSPSPRPYLGIHHPCIGQPAPSSPPQCSILPHVTTMPCLCQLWDHFPCNSAPICGLLPLGCTQTQLQAPALALPALSPPRSQPSESRRKDGEHGKVNTPLWNLPGLLPPSPHVCSYLLPVSVD